MATISETLFLNGSYPTRIDQSININSQIATAIYTYSDGSKVYGAYAYGSSTAVDYLAAAYGLTTVATPVPVSTLVPPTLSGFAVAANGLSITYANSGAPVTVINGSYSINNVATPLVLASSGFTTTQIRMGDIVKISIFSATPATSVVSAATVTNGSTVAALPSTPPAPLPTRPLVFNLFNLGASATAGTATIKQTELSMAVSAPQLSSEFNELQYSQASSPYYEIAFEANSNFTRNLANTQPIGATPIDILNHYNIIVGVSTITNTMGSIHSNDTLPLNSIVSLKKAANGRDILVSSSTDGVNFTPIVNCPDVLLGLNTFYIKVMKNGTSATPDSLINIPMTLR